MNSKEQNSADFKEEFQLMERYAVKVISEKYRVAFQTIKIRGKKFFQIIKERHKKGWPEEMWVVHNSSPLMAKGEFKSLMEVILARGQEIEEMVDD